MALLTSLGGVWGQTGNQPRWQDDVQGGCGAGTSCVSFGVLVLPHDELFSPSSALARPALPCGALLGPPPVPAFLCPPVPLSLVSPGSPD